LQGEGPRQAATPAVDHALDMLFKPRCWHQHLSHLQVAACGGQKHMPGKTKGAMQAKQMHVAMLDACEIKPVRKEHVHHPGSPRPSPRCMALNLPVPPAAA
jgi:hypothetical protein